ncbi:hypothetical protein ACIBF1_01825 [Spirillospora sp. NPDC050679]
MMDELSYMSWWRWALSACLVVGAGVASLGYGLWLVGLLLAVGAVAVPAQWLAYMRWSERQAVPLMVTRYGEVLDGHEFDPRADGVTEAMLRDYQEALDVYERVKRLEKGDADRVRAELGRGYEAIDRLDLQWRGSDRASRSKREGDAAQHGPGERALRISERPWEGEPLAPLHVIDGRGDKVQALPEWVGRETVVEFRNLGTGRAWVHAKEGRMGSPDLLFTCDEGTTERAPLVDYSTVPSHLKVEAKGEWTLALLDFAGVPRFADSYSSQGADVFLYTGEPALAKVTVHGGDSYPGFALYVMEAEDRDLVTFSSGVVPLAGPTLLHVAGGTRWYVDVQPLGAVRCFDREIEGTGNDVVRYTGPTAQARIRHADRLRVRLLDEKLQVTREMFDRHDGGEVVVRLEQGSLLHVGADEGHWSIGA